MSFHPVRSEGHSPRSHIYYNEAKFPEYRYRKDKAYSICSRYTGWSDTASSSRRCRTRNGFPLPSTVATDSRSGGCLAGAPCKSCRSAREHAGKRACKPKSPGGDAPSRFALLQAGDDMVVHVRKPSSEEWLHDDGGNPPFL